MRPHLNDEGGQGDVCGYPAPTPRDGKCADADHFALVGNVTLRAAKALALS